MSKVTYLTDNELDNAIDELQARYKANGSDFIIPKEESFVFGFKIIYSFIKTSLGWVEHHRVIDRDEIFYCLKESGSKEDKIQFNASHNLGSEFNMPITRKEIALDNKAGYKSSLAKHHKDLARASDIRSNKSHQNDLKKIRSQGFSTLRRTKKTISDNLFKFIWIKDSDTFFDSIMNDYYLSVPGIKNQGSIPCLYSPKDIHECLVGMKRLPKYKDIVIPSLEEIEKKLEILAG